MEKEKKKIKIKNIILIILAIIICIAIYYVSTTYYANKRKTEVAKQEQEQREQLIKEQEIPTEKLYTLENYPKVDASLATQPLATALIKNFTQEEVQEEQLNYSNTHPAYEKLIKDEVDLILVTEPSQEELELASQQGVELEVIPVVKEGFVFYVNAKNPIESLTTEQIQKIYTGEITNWKQVGGNDEQITAYQRPTNSGSQTGMLSLVMKDYPLMEAPKEKLIGTMEEIINQVSDYNNGTNAIGYSYYYYATTMFQTIDKNVASNIKLLGINDIKPENKTIQNSTYPYTTAYYIVINKADSEDSASRKLAKQFLSTRGQKVAKSAGYVPVK